MSCSFAPESYLNTGGIARSWTYFYWVRTVKPSHIDSNCHSHRCLLHFDWNRNSYWNCRTEISKKITGGFARRLDYDKIKLTPSLEKTSERLAGGFRPEILPFYDLNLFSRPSNRSASYHWTLCSYHIYSPFR